MIGTDVRASGFSYQLARNSLLALALLGSVTKADEHEPVWHTLAAYWAPVIAQSLESNFNTDIITSLDYDGNWDLTDNALKGVPMPSVVYYWVTDTTEYTFVGYGLHHVGGVVKSEDGEAQQIGSNMQGVVLAIRKSDEQPHGRFVALRTWGTDSPMFYTERSADEVSDEAAGWLDENVRVRTGAGENIGDIDFAVDPLGFHPVIYSRAGDHGVVGEKAQAEFPEGPPIFEASHVVDWRWISLVTESAQAKKSRRHRPGNSKISGGEHGIPPDDGLLYRYEGDAMAVIGALSRGRGTVLHHWNLIAYDLEPISEMWSRRLAFESGDATTFSDYGVFAGSEGNDIAARAPWAWGEIFFDPAGAFAELLPDPPGEITATSFEDPAVLAAEYAARFQN